jgi:lipopolysaccharide-induced tumor necrosis factor-alpha factor
LMIRNLGRTEKSMQCPHCQRQMVTRVRDQADCVTIVVVIILLFLFWPLFWLPFCVPCCKTTVHSWYDVIVYHI